MSIPLMPELKPLTMGQLLDRAFRLYRQHFLQLVGIVGIMQIPSILINILTAIFISSPPQEWNTLLNNPEDIQSTIGIGAIIGVIAFIFAFIFTQIGTAVITRFIADSYLGHKTGILPAFRRIGKAWLSLIGAFLIAIITLICIFLIFLIPCLGQIFAIPAFGVVIYGAFVVLPLIASVIVLEKKSATASLSRAWNLARTQFWWAFGFMLLLNFLVFIITFSVSAFSQFAAATFLQSATPQTIVIIQNLFATLISILFVPLQLTAIVLLYFDLRVKTEGFDIALLAAAGSTTGETAVTETAPERHESSWPTGNEWLKLSGISIGGVLLVIAFGVILTTFSTLFLSGLP